MKRLRQEPRVLFLLHPRESLRIEDGAMKPVRIGIRRLGDIDPPPVLFGAKPPMHKPLLMPHSLKSAAGYLADKGKDMRAAQRTKSALGVSARGCLVRVHRRERVPRESMIRAALKYASCSASKCT